MAKRKQQQDDPFGGIGSEPAAVPKAARKPTRRQKGFPGMVPEAQQEMEQKVLEIVEAQREVAVAKETVDGLKGELAELLRGAKLLRFKHQGYVAEITASEKLTVKAGA